MMNDEKGKSYLLDTSALCGVSGNSLAQVAQKHDLFVSPFCFWEILCHLDEQTNFVAQKKLLLKFEHVQILDHPVAIIEAPFLAKYEDRIPDNDLIEAALAALREASTIDEFYSMYIDDGKGSTRLISECAARIRNILRQEEMRYVTVVQNIISLFKSRDAQYNNSLERYNAILSLIAGWTTRLKDEGATDADLLKQLTSKTFIYYSYIFHRAMTCYRNGTNRPECNDYEDANLCLHLSLDVHYHVIAGDKKLRKAIEDTLVLLRAHDQRISPSLQISDTETFKRLSNEF